MRWVLEAILHLGSYLVCWNRVFGPRSTGAFPFSTTCLHAQRIGRSVSARAPGARVPIALSSEPRDRPHVGGSRAGASAAAVHPHPRTLSRGRAPSTAVSHRVGRALRRAGRPALRTSDVQLFAAAVPVYVVTNQAGQPLEDESSGFLCYLDPTAAQAALDGHRLSLKWRVKRVGAWSCQE